MKENELKYYNNTDLKQKESNSNISISYSIPHYKTPSSLKISNETYNKFNHGQNQNNLENQIENIKYDEIEKIIKNTNKNTLEKYNNNLDKKIKYLKLMNSQKYSPDNNNSNTNNFSSNNISYEINKKFNNTSEYDILKRHATGESTFENSDNRNYIRTDFENSNKKIINQKNQRVYENIIKKNICNSIYYKHRSKNMSFKLKKNKSNDKNEKYTLEKIHNKENIILNYKKFENTFLIINDCISITNKTIIKNTNNSFLKLLSFLNNNEILHLFSANREIRSCIIGCLAYKVKEKILPDFTQKYCQEYIFNNKYNFMILAKLYKKDKLRIRFILSIKPKITKFNTNIINKRIKIAFCECITDKFKKDYEKIKVNTSYIFEIVEKLYPKNFWVFKENTSYHYDENGKAYYNNIMQFWPGDKTLININLLSEIGIIDFDSFMWIEPKMIEIKNKKSINSIDNCEVEEIIHEWNKISLLENSEIVKKNINDLFGLNFIIKEINYDDVGYFFFKIILKAFKVGVCNGREGNLGIKINVSPINSNITNEIKKNGLIFDENNELTVNVGDIITFYISQNKMDK